MGFLDKLDPEIAQIAVDGAKALAVLVWRRLTGDSSSEDSAKAIEAIKRRALAAAADAALEEMRVLAAAVGLKFATDDLADQARALAAALVEAEKVGRDRMDFPPERVETVIVEPILEGDES